MNDFVLCMALFQAWNLDDVRTYKVSSEIIFPLLVQAAAGVQGLTETVISGVTE